MLLDFILLLLGGAGLYFGAEWLVLGASRLALTLGVSPLVIGLTIVSYGTSAPELVVSLVAAFEGRSAIALGNVVGSNIANIGLILGITALVAPPRVDASLRKRELPILFVATAALPAILIDGLIARPEAAVLFIGAIGFTYATFRWASPHPGGELDDEGGPSNKWVLGLLVLVGLSLLVGGGQAFVSGAAGVARRFGMSERLVGLTIVAVGTSLPELAASVVAAVRGHSELAIGNVVGSNLFNLLLVLGATSLLHPISGNLGDHVYDVGAMLVLTLVCIVSLSRARAVTRGEGVAYTLAYLAFLGGLGFVP